MSLENLQKFEWQGNLYIGKMNCLLLFNIYHLVSR